MDVLQRSKDLAPRGEAARKPRAFITSTPALPKRNELLNPALVRHDQVHAAGDWAQVLLIPDELLVEVLQLHVRFSEPLQPFGPGHGICEFDSVRDFEDKNLLCLRDTGLPGEAHSFVLERADKFPHSRSESSALYPHPRPLEPARRSAGQPVALQEARLRKD